MSQADWDRMFMRAALAVATKSKDHNTKVGAILVSPDKRDVAFGFNGFPEGVEDDLEVLARTKTFSCGLGKDDLVIHAEMNALANCKTRPNGWTLYVTHTPCAACAKHLPASGIARVVALNRMTKTDMGQDKTGHIFAIAGVGFEFIDIPSYEDEELVALISLQEARIKRLRDALYSISNLAAHASPNALAQIALDNLRTIEP